MTVYAISSRSRGNYIVEGKRYLARNEDDGGFNIIDEDGDELYCLWKGCAHLEGGDWSRVEEDSSHVQ